MPRKSHALFLHYAWPILLCPGFAAISHEANADMLDLMKQYFKQYDVYLSPEVHGAISKHGVPLRNVEVYRNLDYDKAYRDTAQTDLNGQFSFPEKIIKSSRPGKLFDETRIRQVIGLVHEDEKYLLWYLTDDIGQKGAIAEHLRAMKCDLTTPEMEFAFDNHEHPGFPHAAFSICRWEQ